MATVGVTVVPASGRPNSLIAQHLVRRLDSALTPFSGSRPACAARPWTVTSNVAGALAAGLQRPAVGRRLEHEHRAAGDGPAPR